MGEIQLKKCMLLMLVSFIFILSACSKTEEDTQEYSGIINNEQSLGYEYSVLKEQNKLFWTVGYKGDISIIEESPANQDNLVNYMNAVNDSKLEFIKLIISGAYILFVIIVMLLLYKKNIKILKDGSVITAALTGIAVYIAFKAAFDLISLLQDTKYYYLVLIN